MFINPALSELEEGGGGGGGGENVAEQPLVYTDQGRLDRTKFGNHITQLGACNHITQLGAYNHITQLGAYNHITQLGASAHTVVCVYDVMLILLRQLRLQSAAVTTSIY